MDQIIIHVDMDAFYASVEMRDDPSLRYKPLIIGSLPNERGVVATCSYAARKYGVRSGMNIKEAYRLCPKGIYKHPNFEKYRAVSNQLHDIWNTYASSSEYIALDEAYLDVTQQAVDLTGAREIARLIKERTRSELRLSCSVGVAYCKAAAKIASEEKKPNGYFEVPDADAFISLITDRDVSILYTVGAKTAEKLHAAGIKTVRDIRSHPEDVIKLLGKQGHWITQLANGIDKRKVTPYRPEDAKSIGRELTFQEDINNIALIKDILLLLSISVDHRAKKVGLYGYGVTLKLTYSNMRSISRSHICEHCDSVIGIYEEALKLLEQVDIKPIRLIGVSIYNLSGEMRKQLSMDDILTDTAAQREEAFHKALLELGERYHLDFIGNLDKLYHGETLHKTAEYMRKHPA